MTMRISHEAIYRYIYILPRGELRRTLITALRQEHKYRRKKGHVKLQGNRGKIADMLSIEERPQEVADRSVSGHWEGDLIVGLHRKTALGTLVERATRYTLLVPLGKNKSAVAVRRAYAKAFHSLPKELKKTLTYDQGKEMLEHKQFTIDTGIQVYFAHLPALRGNAARTKTPTVSFGSTSLRALTSQKSHAIKSNARKGDSTTDHEPC